jgi:hypothetical protein
MPSAILGLQGTWPAMENKKFRAHKYVSSDLQSEIRKGPPTGKGRARERSKDSEGGQWLSSQTEEGQLPAIQALPCPPLSPSFNPPISPTHPGATLSVPGPSQHQEQWDLSSATL